MLLHLGRPGAKGGLISWPREVIAVNYNGVRVGTLLPYKRKAKDYYMQCLKQTMVRNWILASVEY